MSAGPIPTIMQRSLIDAPASCMWRVVLEDKGSHHRDRHAWDGWATSSTHATAMALAWWSAQFGAFRAARVVEVLQVGA